LFLGTTVDEIVMVGFGPRAPEIQRLNACARDSRTAFPGSWTVRADDL
jgi:hypothetical protein